MPQKSARTITTAFSPGAGSKGKIPYANEFIQIDEIHLLLKTGVEISDVFGRIITIEKELNRIIAQIRKFTKTHEDQKIPYLDFQRKNVVPIYRSIISLYLDMSNENLIITRVKERYLLLKALMEGLDIIITEIEIIDPFPYLKED